MDDGNTIVSSWGNLGLFSGAKLLLSFEGVYLPVIFGAQTPQRRWTRRSFVELMSIPDLATQVATKKDDAKGVNDHPQKG